MLFSNTQPNGLYCFDLLNAWIYPDFLHPVVELSFYGTTLKEKKKKGDFDILNLLKFIFSNYMVEIKIMSLESLEFS